MEEKMNSRYGRNGKQYEIKLNYKTLQYLSTVLHQYKDDGLRDTAEKRSAHDQSTEAIRRGIGQAYKHFLSKGTKPRNYYFKRESA
jgi:hypothetical protein